MCCKLLAIPVLAKSAGIWCRHCAPGRGCKIHPERPEACHAFFCRWMLDPGMSEEWRPDRSKLVILADENPDRILALVDPGMPDAWRREPYHTVLRRKAAQALPSGGSVIVVVNGNATVLLPSGEQFIGAVETGDSVVVNKAWGPNGVEFAVKVVKGPASDDKRTG